MLHINLIGLNENTVEKVTEKGLRTKKGEVYVDVSVTASSEYLAFLVDESTRS